MADCINHCDNRTRFDDARDQVRDLICIIAAIYSVYRMFTYTRSGHTAPRMSPLIKPANHKDANTHIRMSIGITSWQLLAHKMRALYYIRKASIIHRQYTRINKNQSAADHGEINRSQS
jgi:hypothetical protein